jgi:hypothetical protein
MEEHPVPTNSTIMPGQQESHASQQGSLEDHHNSTPLYESVGDLSKPAINTALPGDKQEPLSTVIRITFRRQRNSESTTEDFPSTVP